MCGERGNGELDSIAGIDESCGDKEVGGATMVEYAILVALLAVVCIVSIEFLGRTLSVTFSGIASMLQ